MKNKIKLALATLFVMFAVFGPISFARKEDTSSGWKTWTGITCEGSAFDCYDD